MPEGECEGQVQGWYVKFVVTSLLTNTILSLRLVGLFSTRCYSPPINLFGCTLQPRLMMMWASMNMRVRSLLTSWG